MFRLEEDRGVINRMGFNNAGLEAYRARLAALPRPLPAVLGANIGVNKEGAEPRRDYPALYAALAPLADYVAVNVSSPNTPGLRDLQGEAALIGILEASARGARPGGPPLLVKIAPDLAEDALGPIVEACVAHGVAGLIVSNTTIARPETLRSRIAARPAGCPASRCSTARPRCCGRSARLSRGRLALVGVGGVASGAQAYAKIRAGASLVQLYAGFAYAGPALVPRIKAELAALLRRDGFARVADAVGACRGGRDRAQRAAGLNRQPMERTRWTSSTASRRSPTATTATCSTSGAWCMTASRPYPGVPEALAELKARGKRIVFLTNAPRRAWFIGEMLDRMGLDRALYDGIMSSGEIAWRMLQAKDHPWFARLGKRAFHIGPERDLSVIEDGAAELVADAAEADFLLNTGPDPDRGAHDVDGLPAGAAGGGEAPAADGLRQPGPPRDGGRRAADLRRRAGRPLQADVRRHLRGRQARPRGLRPGAGDPRHRPTAAAWWRSATRRIPTWRARRRRGWMRSGR